jgi:thioredoxin 2
MTQPTHIVCPHCRAVNRVPAERPAAVARCGGCHQPLFDGHPAEVDAAGFERHVAAGDLPVLVDVWAPWCAPCRAMAPQFERAAAALEPGVRLLKLNADGAPDLVGRLGVQGIPALLLLRGGQVVARTAGAMDANRIAAWTRQALAA